MNIFRFYKDEFSKLLKENNYDCNYNKLSVDSPRQSSFGDLAFNAPLILSSSLKKKSFRYWSQNCRSNKK